MTQTISFAVGNIWRWAKSNNRDELISIIRKNCDVRGVELTFARKDELYAFKLSKQNEKWLKKLDYISIHAPFGLMRKADNEKEIIKQLDIISKLYKRVNAKNVVIHPKDVPPPRILNKYNIKFSTENLPKKRNITIADLKKILNKNPKLGICIDVAHAYFWSKYETKKLIEAFEDRITQFHLSATYRRKDHRSLKIASEDFMFSIKPMFKLDVPIVIEEDFKTKSIKAVQDEIKLIKKIKN